MNDYPNPSRNIPNTWSGAAHSTSSFNNYALNSKWGPTPPNQSQSSTPTNPSTLTTTFPSFSGGIPPLYPSISAQSSNSIQGGAPSPFPNPSNNSSNISAGSATHTKTQHHRSAYEKNSISQSSSASSLNALTGGMNKLHINTSYNPYTAGFTPSDFATNSNAHTPIPNSNGPTPTGFRFNNYSNPYSSIATPTTPLNATSINKWGTNTLQTTAAAAQAVNTMNNINNINNINAMNINYVNHLRMKMNVAATGAPGGNLSANSSYGVLPNLSQPSSANQSKTNLNSPPNDLANIPRNERRNKLNSNAVPYQPTQPQALTPQNALSAQQQQRTATATALTQQAPNATTSAITTPMNLQQLQHQQKAERVPYSYPSYAEAVSKTDDPSLSKVDAESEKQIAAAAAAAVTEDGVLKAKMSTESEEAIQALNPPSWPCNPRHSKFYVIKSFGEDDVHKSIKYNLWCSTERGNRKLDEAFNEAKRINAVNNNDKDSLNLKEDKKEIDPRDTTRGCPVYLFFSVNRSGCFCGMAQMISNYYADRHFGSWVQDGKWQGSFIVKWIYVKDIPNKDLKDIQLPNNDNRPVTFSRDTQEIPFAQGIEMLRRFIKYEPKTNILQDFKYYDDRERDIKHKRTQQIILQQLQPQMQPQMQQQHNVSDIGHGIGIGAQHHEHHPQHHQLNQHNQRYPQHHNVHNQRYPQQQHSKYVPQSQSSSQIEGYAQSSYRRDRDRDRNQNQNNKYQNQKRKYYSKNDRDRTNNNRYPTNRYPQSNAGSHPQKQSQYGNYQILKRNSPQNTHNIAIATPGHNHNHINTHVNNTHVNQNDNNQNQNQNQNENDHDNNSTHSNTSSNRQRYNNRNRNRWVPK